MRVKIMGNKSSVELQEFSVFVEVAEKPDIKPAITGPLTIMLVQLDVGECVNRGHHPLIYFARH